jgi:hypothetical protein
MRQGGITLAFNYAPASDLAGSLREAFPLAAQGLAQDLHLRPQARVLALRQPLPRVYSFAWRFSATVRQ